MAAFCAFLPLHRDCRRARIRPTEAYKAAVCYVRNRYLPVPAAGDECLQELAGPRVAIPAELAGLSAKELTATVAAI
jgi:hypothetical protein